SVSFDITTAAPPLEHLGVEDNHIGVEALLADPAGECSQLGILLGSPKLGVLTAYATPIALALWATSALEAEEPATKSVSGATTTLAFTSGALANAGFSCAN